MNEDEIVDLAKGLVPFVREVVTEAVTPLAARMAELEARPLEKGESGPPGLPGPKGDSGELAVLPSELAEQVARAVRLLHESPPVEQCKDLPQPTARVTMIARDEDGNFVPVYDDERT